MLVIDEAYSVLFSRDRARHSWEISFTNEFLTRMEHFRGILICTTNRMADLDQAAIRRFNRKIGFDYLTAQSSMIFYEKLLEGLVKIPIGEKVIPRLMQLTNLAPGDFKTVRDRFAFYPPEAVNHQILVDALPFAAFKILFPLPKGDFGLLCSGPQCFIKGRQRYPVLHGQVQIGCIVAGEAVLAGDRQNAGHQALGRRRRFDLDGKLVK